jgi:hypothetical protein
MIELCGARLEAASLDAPGRAQQIRADRETNNGIQKDKNEKEGSNVFVGPIGLHSTRPSPSLLERINKRRNI